MAEFNVIREFRHNYRREQAIWWYTRECFIYQMLNRALPTLDADTLIHMGFFIRDLYQQLHQLHAQQLSNYYGKPFIVYRGQALLKTDFEKLKKRKGGLLSFNNFLSTSTRGDVSLRFAESSIENTDMVGIFFIMTIDPRVSSGPFASIKEVSYHKAEEILFSMHTVFRVTAIKQMVDNNQLYQVDLELTSDDDQQLRLLTNQIREKASGEPGWDKLGSLLLTIGQFNKAEELYNVLLKQTSNESGKAHYYHQLGYVKDHQGDYEKAIWYYEQGLGIEEKTLSVNHPSLATSYNNIGSVYINTGEYSKALSFYEKVLEILKKAVSPNHSHLATSYSNIGSVYTKLGEYPKALSYFGKALEIRQRILPSNHPDLAISYGNIGPIYNNMGEYSKALPFYEKAIEIQEKILPLNHPDLATSYNNIGLVYIDMGEYSKALSFYDKTREIFEKTLPANHPSLATSYNNIGLVYIDMGEYSKALSFYEKSLGIRKKTLP
ncbi:unnamed protein product [Adineta steineri]|uniref:NAD(P)(+)--arginine ADP-ribosyltransferase n=1 Tax=Adineta steineri TaxID=433720 RepID=A0A813Z3Q4_9BILA|nr:unnamed protein product [Adineta steineri]CAF1006560.1 unnamed protein product [Adineta steineri]CAF3983597.1 unnamed protein product [Adineta steineri]CAF4094084.1 unnamed protein product [Adineta steineri]